MPLKIVCNACPFDVDNSYKERFLPNSFDEFLREPESKSITMKFMHERHVGHWNGGLHVAANWLHASGVMDDRDAEYAVRNGQTSEVSIGYIDRDVLDALNKDRLDESAMLRTRLGRGIDIIGKRLCTLPPSIAAAKMAEFLAMPKERSKKLAEAAAREADSVTVKRAQLGEISIVDVGSFKGTRLYWERI